MTYAEAVNAKSAAETRWANAQKLERGQSFGRFLDDGQEKMNAAATFWADKEYAFAKGKYDEVAALCDKLFQLEAKRQAAQDARAKAAAAQTAAKDAGAEADAGIVWANAGLLMEQAAADFERADFPQAQANWGEAAKKYAEAATQAREAQAVREAEARKQAEAKRKAAEAAAAAAAAKKAAEEAARKPDLKSPFANSLGMEFVPVAGLSGVLFSKWETRNVDYRAFKSAHDSGSFEGNSLNEDSQPAVNVSWDEAQAFCAWLTQKEQAAKRSFSGWTVIDGYNDGYAVAAPVGSFDANANGLYDMGGNVWEWCEDFYDGQSGSRVLRGGSWTYSFYPRSLLSSCRLNVPPDGRGVSHGFRVVLSR